MFDISEIQQPLLQTELSGLGFPRETLPDLNFEESYCYRTEGTTITYTDINEVYIKFHQKLTKQQIQDNVNLGKDSWMRVADGKVNIKIENKNQGETVVKVFVKRTDSSLKQILGKSKGDEIFVKNPTPLVFDIKNISLLTNACWSLTVDLNSVYSVTEDGMRKEVYQLSTGDIRSTNKFQLSTEVHCRQYNNYGAYEDTLIAERLSEPFLIRGEERKGKQTTDSNRRILSSCGKSPESFELSPSSTVSFEGESDRKRRRTEQNGLRDEVFNSIMANKATIKHLNCNHQATHNKDIAYHVKLNNPEQYGSFGEGDVVVFLESEDEDIAIELLNAENLSKAILAGVISRSYYIEGNVPTKNETAIDDLVCIVGIVDVKTIGPVICGEHLYAAPNRAGVAIGDSSMSLFHNNSEDRPLLLGQALETKSDVALNEEVLVQSFVSVFLGIGRTAAARTFLDSEVKLKENFDTIVEDASRKVKCRVLLLKILLLIIICIISLALWQRYAPNTLFRRSICKQGSTEDKMVLKYSTSWQEITANFLGFEYSELEKKLYKKIKHCPKEKCGNGTTRYFMNFDRCSNRGVAFGNEFVDDTPTVSGPEIIGISEKCKITSLHYFINGNWVKFVERHRKSKPRVYCHIKWDV